MQCRSWRGRQSCSMYIVHFALSTSARFSVLLLYLITTLTLIHGAVPALLAYLGSVLFYATAREGRQAYTEADV